MDWEKSSSKHSICLCKLGEIARPEIMCQSIYNHACLCLVGRRVLLIADVRTRGMRIVKCYSGHSIVMASSRPLHHRNSCTIEPCGIRACAP